MKPITTFVSATIICCLSGGAWAVEWAGTFTGKAVNSFIGMYPGASTSNLDGVAIDGTFSFSGSSYSIMNSDPSSYSATISGETKLTFNVLDSSIAGTYTYDSALFGVRLAAGPSLQSVTFASQQVPFDDYTDSSLLVSGTGFFDPSDPLSLQAGTVNYAASVEPFSFGNRFRFGTGIQLTSVTFAAPVPEPGTIPTVMAGILALAGSRTVRRRACVAGRAE